MCFISFDLCTLIALSVFSTVGSFSVTPVFYNKCICMNIIIAV